MPGPGVRKYYYIVQKILSKLFEDARCLYWFKRK